MKKRKSWSLLQTHRLNKYFHENNKKRTQLCHPLLYYFLTLASEDKDVGEQFEALLANPSDPVEIKDIHPSLYSKEDIRYYFKKYSILIENGYFQEIDQEKKLSATVHPETIISNLANAKQVTFEVTDRCNLDCRYCAYGQFYSNYDKRETKDLDVRSAKRLLDYLADHLNSTLNRSHDRNIFISFYGGEPLLNFSFIKEIVQYVQKLNVQHNRFTFSMTTNALLLEKYMDFLYEHDFHILISLDGNEANNAYRVLKNGKPGFPIIIENIEALRAKYPAYFLQRVNFNAVLHNKNSVEDVYRFFKERFDKKPMINQLNATGIRPSQIKTFMQTYSNINRSLSQSENPELIEKDMFIKLPNVQQVMAFLHFHTDCCFVDYNTLMYSDKNQRFTRTPTGTCSPFSKKIYVTVNGKILPCEKVSSSFALGSVTPSGVNLDPQHVASIFNAYYDKLRTLCHVCPNADFCKQCIFNLNTIDEPEAQCSSFVSDREYVRYISSIIGAIEEKPHLYTKILKEVIVA